MSGNDYYYYYGQPPGGHIPEVSPQPWAGAWPMQQHQQYAAAAASYTRPPPGYSAQPSSSNGQGAGYSQMRTQQPYHNPVPGTSGRGYQERSGRYGKYNGDLMPPNHYGGRQQGGWHRNQKYKRARSESRENAEPKSKGPKKKKKPLSQNMPSKKEWTYQEAEMAIALEKECNKRFKNQSLLLKFPDLELNKEIVAKFHPAIENVHFQQPSAPRFCFVTLNESVDTEAVIKELNKQKFGDGYITAEYKKDREDDLNVGPDDIDPTTLYVGNLAQEITKEDMVKTFPTVRRIDIGYAKKMKYTRYAFVCFSNVADALEAFKKTHNTQMYSKSLIVRFRRLHGPVGMPGEAKQQNPPRNAAKENAPAQANGTAAPAEEEEEEDARPSSPDCVNDNWSLESEELHGPEEEDSKYSISRCNTPNFEADTVAEDIFTIPRPKVDAEVKVEPEAEPQGPEVTKPEVNLLIVKQEVVDEEIEAIERENGAGPCRTEEDAAPTPKTEGQDDRVDPRVRNGLEENPEVDQIVVTVKQEPRESSESDHRLHLGVTDFDNLFVKVAKQKDGRAG